MSSKLDDEEGKLNWRDTFERLMAFCDSADWNDDFESFIEVVAAIIIMRDPHFTYVLQQKYADEFTDRKQDEEFSFKHTDIYNEFVEMFEGKLQGVNETAFISGSDF